MYANYIGRSRFRILFIAAELNKFDCVNSKKKKSAPIDGGNLKDLLLKLCLFHNKLIMCGH